MPERKRALLDDKIVTILDGKIGGRGKTTIRNGFGFTEEVEAKKLKPLDKSEPEASYRYEDAND